MTQVETPSLPGCSIFFWLVTHTHTGEGGICPLPPSPPVLCLASFHPFSPPSVLMSGVLPEVISDMINQGKKQQTKSWLVQ